MVEVPKLYLYIVHYIIVKMFCRSKTSSAVSAGIMPCKALHQLKIISQLKKNDNDQNLMTSNNLIIRFTNLTSFNSQDFGHLKIFSFLFCHSSYRILAIFHEPSMVGRLQIRNHWTVIHRCIHLWSNYILQRIPI